jgi:predicted membrane protein
MDTFLEVVLEVLQAAVMWIEERYGRAVAWLAAVSACLLMFATIAGAVFLILNM